MERATTRAVALACAAALAAALAPAAATAATGSRLVITGAGFGHGVGMSQYGAYGFALRGADFRTILAHYYRGTTIQPLGAERTVRVLLKSGPRIKFSGASSTLGERQLDPAKTYTASAGAAGEVVVRDVTGTVVGTGVAPLRVIGSATTPLLLRGKAQNGITDGTYRGAFEFRPTPGGNVLAINALGLESYVRGVVSAESPATWPAAALEAQAVAARTYAVTTARAVTNGFDQFADVRSQVYQGIKAETPTTDAAVAATSDLVVAYNGNPVVTFFFSTSGGRTENVENVFEGAEPSPWLVSVEDPHDDESPVHRWGPITRTLKSATKAFKGLVKGSLRAIRVVRRGASPRIVSADLIGTGGVTRVTGEQIKVRLKLRDTWVSFRVVDSKGKTVRAPDIKISAPTTTTTTPTTTTPAPAPTTTPLPGTPTVTEPPPAVPPPGPAVGGAGDGTTPPGVTVAGGAGAP